MNDPKKYVNEHKPFTHKKGRPTLKQLIVHRIRVNDTNPIFEESYTGICGIICPHCFHYRFLQQTTSAFFGWDDDHKEKENARLYATFMVTCTCEACGKLITVEPVDPNITATLAMLNKKKYKTIYSCEGTGPSTKRIHILEDGTAIPQTNSSYIKFANAEQKVILKDYPLPVEWTDTDREGFHIHEQRRNIKPTFRDKMEAIYQWANSLPDWNEYRAKKGES